MYMLQYCRLMIIVQCYTYRYYTTLERQRDYVFVGEAKCVGSQSYDD